MKLVELIKYARIPIEQNSEGCKEVLILADSDTEELVYQALAAAAYELGLEPNIMLMVARSAHGNEPTKSIAHAIMGADLVVGATSKSITHTEAIRGALQKGIRYVAMPGVTVDMMTRGAATADMGDLMKLTGAAARALSLASRAEVTSPEGTDVGFSIEDRKAFPLCGTWKSGSPIVAFPDGEAAIAVVEGSCTGKIVFDLSVHMLGLLDRPIEITVENGRALKIEGGSKAKELEEILESRGDENSRSIGEFAVGTNPCARITGNPSEDKKRIGSAHFALGDNKSLGGAISSRIHLDGVITRPSVRLDGKLFIQDGKFLEI